MRSGSSRRFASAQFRGERLNLPAGLLERAGTIDLFRGQTEFFLGRHLSGNPAAGFRFAEAARGQALDLLLGFAPGNDEAVEISVNARFDEQRGFDERGVTLALACPFIKLAEDDFGDTGVDDGVQAVKFRAIGENECGKFRAIDAALGVGDGGTKFAEDFVVGGLTRLDELVGERVCVKNRKAHIAEHDGNGAFAAGDSAGESESQHFSDHRAVAVDGVAENSGATRRNRAAFMVLLMSMVMVIGPTPPGTGVRAPAMLTASG